MDDKVRPIRPIRGARAGFTSSPLASPDTPIRCLASQFQSYMHLPDPMSLYVTIGAMAGNMMTGTPIWLMLIGPSGCGKTMLLKSLLKLKGVVPVSSIKGEAALLSGVKKKERARDATGGLLNMLGENGCLAFMDFTSVLSKSREAINELMGALRELYDKTYTRDVGTEGGRRLQHTGRVCLIAGVTPAIDRHTEVTSEMGERCLYFRYPPTDGWQESMMAAQETDVDGTEESMQLLVEALFLGVGLKFEEPVKRRKLERGEAERVVEIALLGARARSPVPRDSYSRQVVDVTSPEVASRMSKQLAALYLGMEVVGVGMEERWKGVRKVAMDSMPLARRLILGEVVSGEGHVKVGEVAKRIRISETAARRVVEDLELLGMVKRQGEGLDVTDWVADKIKGIEEGEKRDLLGFGDGNTTLSGG